jgi:hypothetical protein
MINELIKVQVSGTRESDKSIGALVDLIYNDKGEVSSSSRLVWFPKSISTLDEEEYLYDHFGKEVSMKRYFITAPKWFLEKNNIKYDIDK